MAKNPANKKWEIRKTQKGGGGELCRVGPYALHFHRKFLSKTKERGKTQNKKWVSAGSRAGKKIIEEEKKDSEKRGPR